jgi:tetratricopeptide (TPR) repeat protein
VVEAAPFDGNAWFELAGACEAMQRAWQSHSMRGEILSYLAEGESLRPVSPAAKLMYGDFYFRSAMRALRFRDKPGKDFELAMTAYGEAAARYPLAPGFRILTGDAALMQGETQAAAAQYMQALRTDVLINDLDVCLSSIFTDPRPGAAARHGFDGEILERLGATPLTLPSPQGGEGGVRGAGLLLRRLLATATLLNEDKRSHALDSALAGQHRAEMLQTGQELPQMLEELPLRAHAALFHALTFELAGDAPAAAKAAAWEQACKLQDESVQQGKPGTVPYLFYVLDLWYRQGKR